VSSPSVSETVQVALVRRSWVVEGGVMHEFWRVRFRDAWIRPEEHPSAASLIARDDPEDGSVRERSRRVRAPGEQYRAEVELALPRGTLVERVLSGPARARRELPKGVLGWLTAGPYRARRAKRAQDVYVVVGNYRLRKRS
jgi:hypothetical protein